MNVLITGGTGSLGKTLVKKLLAKPFIQKIVIFSRDELKQWEMQQQFTDRRLRFYLGDIRNPERIKEAMRGVNTVYHTAAIKQVPTCEYNPWEAVLTNVVGSQNVINAALENDVSNVISLSTDKAVEPVNHYGATKKTAEGLFTHANIFGRGKTSFCNVRYGNVLASRGSVVQLFKEQAKTGEITITDPRMTRFWWTLDEAAEFVLKCDLHMQGGETFIPKIKSSTVLSLASCIAPDAKSKDIGIRGGEKLHEILISPHEIYKTYDMSWGAYAIHPQFVFSEYQVYNEDNPVPSDFEYTSDKCFMTKGELESLVGKVV